MFASTVKRAAWKAAGMLILAGVVWAAQGAPGWAAPGWADAPTRKNTGPVQFEFTPRGIVNGRFQFDLTVTTHSVDLSKLDVQKNGELRVGTAVYRPVAPVPLTGHHGKVKIEFPLAQVPDAFEIAIRGVPGMGPIVLRWP